MGRDGHQSKFSLQWVTDNLYTAEPQVERFLWDGPRINKEHLPVTTSDHRMKTQVERFLWDGPRINKEHLTSDL
ncbi:hypothetical protein ACOMHN_003598 [Nucella lapillus]